MRINFRQGIISYQDGGFLRVSGSRVDLIADNDPVLISSAQDSHNYTHSENNSVNAAWLGPFDNVADYWLYFDFNLLTLNRTFKHSTLEPVVQSIPPGYGSSNVQTVIPGEGGMGAFIVDGYFLYLPGRELAISNSTNLDGNYTVHLTTYDHIQGQTTIQVTEDILVTSIADGVINTDIDSSGLPLKTPGRLWYNTETNRHYILNGTVWSEIIAVYAAKLSNGNTFTSQSINGGQNFEGTQIGNMSSVLSGRPMFDESANPIRRDDNTFFTTEDQFFSAQSIIESTRLESNVSRAQYTGALGVAAHTVMAWRADGQVQVSQYNDVGFTVVGMLTENLNQGEVGSIIVQGMITNPLWDWTGGSEPIAVGSPLWVDNGNLVSADPHLTDPINFPSSRVPVARVLSKISVIFEQGLGGKGDQGPPGQIENLPPATASVLGAVVLNMPYPLNPDFPKVVVDVDPRMSDARVPLAHTHIATDVSFVPVSGKIASNNVQSAITEVEARKLNISGGTMTGDLILNTNPTTNLQAATKLYVDNLVSGLVWLEPVDKINMISDTVLTPPLSPEIGDAYIVPPGATGDWGAIATGNITTYTSIGWRDDGPLTSLNPNGPRIGISFTSSAVPSGSFQNAENFIAVYDTAGNLIQFEQPTTNNAVYVSNASSEHAFEQYAFDGNKWVLFGAAGLVADDLTTELHGNVLSVIQASNGGIVDALQWNGLTTPPDFGTVGQLLSTNGNGNTIWTTLDSGNNNCIIDGDGDSHVTVGYLPDDGYGNGGPCDDQNTHNIMMETVTGSITMETVTGSIAIKTTNGLYDPDMEAIPYGNIDIIAGDNNSNYDGGRIVIKSGNNSSNSYKGGQILLSGGNSGSNTSSIEINSTGIESLPGNVNITLKHGSIDSVDCGVEISSNSNYASGTVKLFDRNNSFYTKLQSSYTLNNVTNFTLPPTNGTNKEILQTDGIGNTSWTGIPFDLAFFIQTINGVVDDTVVGSIATARDLQNDSNLSAIVTCNTTSTDAMTLFVYTVFNGSTELLLGDITIPATSNSGTFNWSVPVLDRKVPAGRTLQLVAANSTSVPTNTDISITIPMIVS